MSPKEKFFSKLIKKFIRRARLNRLGFCPIPKRIGGLKEEPFRKGRKSRKLRNNNKF